VRARLLVVLLPLLATLLAALGVPLAQSYAGNLTQELFIERLGDARRFATRADATLRGLSGMRPLESELRRTDELLDVAVAVIDAEGRVVVASRPQALTRDPRARRALRRALAGQAPERPATAWPWQRDPIVLGEPVGQDSQVIGAVVLIAPTDEVRERVTRRLVVLAAAGAGVLLLALALAALPLTRWVLRPVQDLAAAAQQLAAGRLDARAPENEGPPELRGLAATFNRMARSLAAALTRERAFVADASHQLRNPLGALRLRVEGLEPHVDAEGARDLRLALEETDRLAVTVDGLLRLARAEATEAERIDVDLGALAERRVETWRPSLEAVGSPLRLHLDSARWARAAPDAVEHALDVLLDNARKFAAGAPVDVTLADAGEAVELVVRDRGPGLGPDELDHAGERFWRSRRHQNVDGTGLGLALARALVEGAGGELRLEPREPGLAAAVRLPPASGEPGGTSAPRPDAGRAERSRSPRAG
jgi:signal transduction histidine kinase